MWLLGLLFIIHKTCFCILKELKYNYVYQIKNEHSIIWQILLEIQTREWNKDRPPDIPKVETSASKEYVFPVYRSHPVIHQWNGAICIQNHCTMNGVNWKLEPGEGLHLQLYHYEDMLVLRRTEDMGVYWIDVNKGTAEFTTSGINSNMYFNSCCKATWKTNYFSNIYPLEFGLE
jgi:hypothetical protein